MAGLTQRGWNNVIIFAMLAMILLFNNVTNKLTENTASTDSPLLPEDAVIMTVEYDQNKIERIGNGWRITPAAGDITHAPEQVVDAWHKVTLAPSQTPAQGTPLVVVIWLAGEMNGRVLQIYTDNQPVLFRYQGQTYQLISPALTELFPTELP